MGCTNSTKKESVIACNRTKAENSQNKVHESKEKRGCNGEEGPAPSAAVGQDPSAQVATTHELPSPQAQNPLEASKSNNKQPQSPAAGITPFGSSIKEEGDSEPLEEEEEEEGLVKRCDDWNLAVFYAPASTNQDPQDSTNPLTSATSSGLASPTEHRHMERVLHFFSGRSSLQSSNQSTSLTSESHNL